MVALEVDAALPGPKRKHRLWPIPPLGRVGTPRGIVNAPAPLNRGGAWRPTGLVANIDEIMIDLPKLPVSVRRPTSRGAGRSPGDRNGAAWGMAAMEPSLLEALGIGSPTTGDTILGRKGRSLPAHKLSDPQECEDGCYWRWLVHTLLEDVAALKRNIEETQDGIKELHEVRKQVREKIVHRARLAEELASMTESLKSLRQQAPKLRTQHRDQQEETQALQRRSRELQDKRRNLEAAVRSSVEWQRGNIRKVEGVEREVEDSRRKQKAVGDQVHKSKEALQVVTKMLENMTSEYKSLQLEMKSLEEKKAAKKVKAPKK